MVAAQTARRAADLSLFVALLAALVMAAGLLWTSSQVREDVDARVAAAVERQNALTSAAANLTAEIDDVMSRLTTVQATRQDVNKRREKLAAKVAAAETARVVALKDKAKSELKRIKNLIDASKKELYEFLNKK